MKVHDAGSTAHRNMERYRTGKVSEASNGKRNFKSSITENKQKKNLKLLNHTMVSHLGKGINFFTMLVTLARKLVQYIWTHTLHYLLGNTTWNT